MDNRLPPLSIALDTSGALISLALTLSDGTVLSHELDGAGASSVSLIDEVTGFLSRAKVPPLDIRLFVVGVGPGSFTGNRLALSVAKGWHAGSGCRVSGVYSLDGAAFSAPVTTGAIVSLADARRGDFFASSYRVISGVRERIHGPKIVAADSVEQCVLGVVENDITAILDPSVPEVLAQSLPHGWAKMTAKGIAPGLLLAQQEGFSACSGESVVEISKLSPVYLRLLAAKSIEERRKLP